MKRDQKFTEYCNICKEEITAKTSRLLTFAITKHNQTLVHKEFMDGLKKTLKILWNKKCL